MVHEYIEDLAVLSSALRSGHAFVSSFVAAARRSVIEAERLIETSAARHKLYFFGNSFSVKPILQLA